MPTIRQIIAVKKLSEILRNSKNQKGISMQRILKESGFSDSQARASTQVVESKGFKELLKEIMPKEKVSELQADGMEAAKIDSYKMDIALSDKEIIEIVESVKGCKVRKINRNKGDLFVTVYFWSPDHTSRLKALDMFYKLTNEYPKDKEETDTNSAIKEYLDKLSKILP